MNAVLAPKPRWPLRLARRAVSPALFDFWASRVNPLWSLEQPLARLVSRTVESRDAATLIFRPNRHWAGMRAGQHVSLGVTVGGRRLVRSYSPTPMADGTLAITVKAIEGGVVSTYLARNASLGEVVTLDAAFGDMTMASASEPLLLLAAGSGITPMRALLRDLAARGMPVNVDLYYWARTQADLCFVDELKALAAAHPRLHVRFLVTREGDAPAPRVEAMPFDAVAAIDQRRVLACGPGAFVEAARERLAGVAHRFEAEAFSLPPATGNVETGVVNIHLTRSGRTLQFARDQSLLEGLEAQGMRPAHGCRMGICNSCACERQSGTTRHILTGDRSSEPSTQVRLCISAPATDLILDL
jgi:stearoyl-CoA 9-desaturase NADPH oxidoreductase